MNQPTTADSAPVEQSDLALVGVGVLAGVVCAAFGWPVVAGLVVGLAAGVPISLRDVRERIIPLRLVYPALAGIVAVGAVSCVVSSTWAPLLWVVACGAGVAGVFALVWLVAPTQLGFGDVRLASLMGGAAGLTRSIDSPIIAVFVAFAGVGVAGLVWQRKRLAFAPFMIAATVMVLVADLISI